MYLITAIDKVTNKPAVDVPTKHLQVKHYRKTNAYKAIIASSSDPKNFKHDNISRSEIRNYLGDIVETVVNQISEHPTHPLITRSLSSYVAKRVAFKLILRIINGGPVPESYKLGISMTQLNKFACSPAPVLRLNSVYVIRPNDQQAVEALGNLLSYLYSTYCAADAPMTIDLHSYNVFRLGIEDFLKLIDEVLPRDRVTFLNTAALGIDLTNEVTPAKQLETQGDLL